MLRQCTQTVQEAFTNNFATSHGVCNNVWFSNFTNNDLKIQEVIEVKYASTCLHGCNSLMWWTTVYDNKDLAICLIKYGNNGF